MGPYKFKPECSDIEELKVYQNERIFIHPIKLETNAIFTGDINKATRLRDGKGMMFFPDNSLYEGCWRDGMAHGEGRLIYSNGDVYEGSWS